MVGGSRGATHISTLGANLGRPGYCKPRTYMFSGSTAQRSAAQRSTAQKTDSETSHSVRSIAQHCSTVHRRWDAWLDLAGEHQDGHVEVSAGTAHYVMEDILRG
jgi:hypothetical protein